MLMRSETAAAPAGCLSLRSSRHGLEANARHPSWSERATCCPPPIIQPGVGLLLLGCNQASHLSPATLDSAVVNHVNLNLNRDAHHHIVTPTFFSPFSPSHDYLNVVHVHDNFSSPLVDHPPYNEIVHPLAATKSYARFHRKFPEAGTLTGLHQQRPRSSPRIRSLTANFDVFPLNMNIVASAPGSPPDLSGSRSSKSSSLCSTSQLSNPDGLVSDITNFEDIGLDDDTHTAQEPARKPAQGRSSPSRPGTGSSAKSGTDHRPALPALRNQVREAVKQKENEATIRKRPQPMGAQRGFTSPVPIFAPTSATITRPRSISPPRKSTALISSTSLIAGTLRPNWNSSRSSLPLPVRRGSWQPRRKSVLELEAEYHDSDEELPDDASLWNVPVSPFPTGDRSARSSFHGSPVRESATQSPRPIPLAHAQTAPDTPPRSVPFSQSLPRNRPPPLRSTSLSSSFSNPPSPRSSRSVRATRTESWNLAMEDLSEEVRIISQNLEYHAEAVERSRAGKDAEGQMPAVNRSLKANTIQLPPVQRGNLDFMPISKEKEAILSRTRPSWLPPKDPREEKKHLREYQQMMAASMEADKKRQEQLQAQKSLKENTRGALNRIWQYYVAESTDLATIDTRVFDLCWRGISPKLRGKVWRRRIGNDLGLTEQSYEKALSRAKTIQSHSHDQLTVVERSMDRWFTDIERDAETAFPELNLFQRSGPLWQDLVNVCEAYACYRSDIGYVYGIQLVGALLLLQVPTPAEAFVLLANCLNRPMPLAFQTVDLQARRRTYNHTLSTLNTKFPRLHDHLFGSLEYGGLGFTAEEVLEPMFRTLFCNGLDIDRLCRLWDIWIFEGDKALVRGAVALLGSLQTQLFEITGDVDLKRRNTQEMLGWGPFQRNCEGGHWILDQVGDEEHFVEAISAAGTFDYRGK